MKRDWYAVQVFTNYEQKIKSTIEEQRSTKEHGDLIGDVCVPIEKIIEIKQGRKRVRDKHLWPGYILVSMVMNEHTWQYIKNINGVISFLGGMNPLPLKPEEVDSVMGYLNKEEDKVVPKYNIEVGDSIRISDGVFVNFVGKVTSMDHAKGKLSVQVTIFGRDTKVEDLEFWQVEKNSSD